MWYNYIVSIAVQLSNNILGRNMNMNSFDELSVMNDDQLQKLFMKVRGDINRRHRQKESVFDLEIELCYIQRELFIRHSRRQAHTEYMSSRQEHKSFA